MVSPKSETKGKRSSGRKAPAKTNALPYDTSQRPKARSGSTMSQKSKNAYPSPSESSSSKTTAVVPSPPSTLGALTAFASSSSTHFPLGFGSSTASSSGTMRESFLESLQERYPDFKPRNDYEIVVLASGNYHGPADGIRAWLDEQIALDVAFAWDFDSPQEAIKHREIFNDCSQGIFADATAMLDRRGCITGRKPKPGAPNVFCRPIPHSPYSVRLFPGSIVSREYCLDFVCTETGEPVNSPPEFEVWVASEKTTPWLGGGGTMRIHSLERSFGISAADIRHGLEKFVLRDGQSYILKRPGHKNLRFKVPMRAEGLDLATEPDEDHLQFPELVF